MIPTLLEKDHLHDLAVLAQAYRFVEVVKALDLVGHEVGDFEARRGQIEGLIRVSKSRRPMMTWSVRPLRITN
jgi:hypothetical protein